MSYILDALRRAESERERGSVPTLHTNPVPADRADGDADPGRPRRWVWAGATLGLLILAALALRAWNPSRESPVVAAAAPAALPLPMLPASQGQVLPAAAPALASSTTVAAAVPATPELRRLQPAPPPEAPPISPAAPPVAAAPAPPAPVVALKDLPDEIRRQLPTLVASGAMYSETPASRMLIVNGQLLREGDKVAPDLVLEQIQLKSAVLNFKGQRLRINY